jgi:hypothetical protein
VAISKLKSIYDLVAEYNALNQSSVNTNSKTSSQNPATSKANSSSSAAPKTDSQNPTTPKDNPQEINSRSGTFTIGSSEDAVKSVMGAPSGVIGDTWSYGYSSVFFRKCAVSSWSEIDVKLNIQ